MILKNCISLRWNNNNKQLKISDKDLDVEDFFWSPDSRKLTFKARDNNGNHDIYLHNLDKDITNKVTNTKGIEKLGNWSPDGEWIVYSVIVGDEDKVGF